MNMKLNPNSTQPRIFSQWKHPWYEYNEKLEVKPEPPTCRASTYTQYDGMRMGSKDDGSKVTVNLLEQNIITPRDIIVGRKIDACYEKCYYKS